jgi:hypothetical protein
VALHRILKPYITPDPKLWPPTTTLTLVIETSQGLKSQSATAIFNYGVTTGIIRSVCALTTIHLPYPVPVPIIDVAPPAWKRALDLLFDPNAIDPITNTPHARHIHAKNLSRNKARDLYPDAAQALLNRKDHNRAEAILIAHYGLLLSSRLILGQSHDPAKNEKRLKPKTLKFDANDPHNHDPAEDHPSK